MPVAVVERFAAEAAEARKSRISGSWLISLFLSQAQVCERLAEGLVEAGFTDTASTVADHLLSYSNVMNVIPVGRGIAPVGMITSYAEVVGCARTVEFPAHGYLALAATVHRLDEILVEVLNAQARKTPALHRAADGGEAVLASGARMAQEVRELAANIKLLGS